MANVWEFSPDAGTTKYDITDLQGRDDIDGINLLENEAVSTGIFTVNADKSVTINGTASETLQLQIHGALQLTDGNYVLTGITELPEGVYWSLQLQSGSWIDVAPGESSKSFTLSSANPIVKARIYVASGTTLSNLVIYPMITDAKYGGIPYRPYNQQSIQHQINDITGVTGVRNLLNNFGYTRVINGLTCTYNTDGTVVVNGTATALSYIKIKELSDINPNSIEGLRIKLSGAPPTSDENKYWLYAKYRNAANTAYEAAFSDFGEGVEFTIPEGRKWEVFMAVSNGQTVSDLTFKPMISLASDPLADYNHYVHYVMTNRELTEAVTPQDITSQVIWDADVKAHYGKVIKENGKYIIQVEVYFKSDTGTGWKDICTFPDSFAYSIGFNGIVRNGTAIIITTDNKKIKMISPNTSIPLNTAIMFNATLFLA